MPYDSIISRADADALMPEDVAADVLQSAISQSAALSLFPQITMSAKQRRLPVVAALPVAYFVNGDTGLKQTTDMAWANKFIEAEEIAAIVPVAEAVLDDADFDVWAAVMPRMAEAVGRALDAAIFFGTNKPATWPAAIVPAATAAANTYVRGTNAAGAGGIAADFNGLFSTVEDDGYDVSGLAATRAFRGRLRNARDTTGQALSNEISPESVYGVPVRYPLRGLWPTGLSAAEAIAGDFSQGILGVRQDLTYKVLDQAVITDATGAVIYNLPQQDMLAIRVVARFGFQVANPMNFDRPADADRYPFGVMLSPAA